MNKGPARFLVAAGLIGALAGVGLDRALIAQQVGVVRTPLVTVPDPAAATHEVTLASVSIAPGATTGRHRHPGIEVGYVLEGELTIEQDGGRPAMNLEPGDAFNTSGVHNGTNRGTTPVKLVVAYVFEKGKPVAEAVP
jgi:quercetin dioxygenase-like cupin family protein